MLGNLTSDLLPKTRSYLLTDAATDRLLLFIIVTKTYAYTPCRKRHYIMRKNFSG